LFWIVLLAILVVILLVYVVIWVVRAHRRKVAAGREDLVGRTAMVETALEPRGVVLIEGEHWTAIIDQGRAEPEEEVVVTKVEGLKLMVTRKQ
jgi:membrane-bound serine protease (ClpP class)